MVDVTERQRVASALAEREETLASVFERGVDSVAVVA